MAKSDCCFGLCGLKKFVFVHRMNGLVQEEEVRGVFIEIVFKNVGVLTERSTH